MSESINKTVLYKRRNFGQRLSASVDFIQGNLIVIFRNILLIAFPLSLVQAFFINSYLNRQLFLLSENVSSGSPTGMLIFGLLYLVVGTFIYAATASMLKAAGEGNLKKDTTLGNLMNDILINAKKTFLIFLFVSITLGVVAFLAGASSSVLVILILLLVLLVLIPPTSLIFYPAYFENMGTWDSIVKGMKLGFKYWGTTFLMLFVSTMAACMIQYFSIIPYYFWAASSGLFSGSESMIPAVIGYIASFIACLGAYLSFPFSIICMAFQYFAVREELEGISVKAKIDDFDNL